MTHKHIVQAQGTNILDRNEQILNTVVHIAVDVAQEREVLIRFCDKVYGTCVREVLWHIYILQMFPIL